MFSIYRMWVNSMGDEHSPTKMGSFDNFGAAKAAAQERSKSDNCRTETRWKVVRESDFSTLCQFGPYRTPAQTDKTEASA